MEILKTSDCAVNLRNMITNRKLLDTHVCADNPRNDSCNDDTGGPLNCPIINQDSIRAQYEICGIVSWGKGCLKSKKEYPGVYTNVSKYLDWIKSNL